MRALGLFGLLIVFISACSDGGSNAGSGGAVGGGASGSGGAPDAIPGGGGGGGASPVGAGGTSATGAGGSGPTGAGGASATGAGGAAATGAAGASMTGGGGASATGAAGAKGSNPLGQDVIDAFVTAHNQARSGPLNPTPNPALPPVTWDPILADCAYNYTLKCQGANGLLSHNPNRTADYQALGGSGYVGENIYGTTASTTTPAAAMNGWMSEAPMFIYANDNLTDAGHYTQVVWRTSVRIGCAIVNCPNLTYHESVLCDYAPGGNIIGQKPY
jgi:pathogenesis-related protein 1